MITKIPAEPFPQVDEAVIKKVRNLQITYSPFSHPDRIQLGTVTPRELVGICYNLIYRLLIAPPRKLNCSLGRDIWCLSTVLRVSHLAIFYSNSIMNRKSRGGDPLSGDQIRSFHGSWSYTLKHKYNISINPTKPKWFNFSKRAEIIFSKCLGVETRWMGSENSQWGSAR